MKKPLIIQYYVQQLRGFGPDVRIYLGLSTLIGFSVMPGIPAVILNLYLVRLGYDMGFIGLLNGLSSLSFALFCMPAGALARIWGMRRAMTLGICLAIVGYGLMPVGESFSGIARDGWFILMAALPRAGLAMFMVNSRPYVMMVAKPGAATHAFSVREAVRPMGGLLGSLIAGFLPGFFGGMMGLSLDSPIPYRYPLILAAIALLPGIYFCMKFQDVRPEAPPRRQTAKEKAKNSPSSVASQAALPLGIIIPLAVVAFFRGSGMGATFTFLNVYMDTVLLMPTSLIGTLRGAAQIVGIAAALLAPMLVQSIGNGRSYIVGLVVTALSIMVLALAPAPWSAAVTVLGTQAMMALVIPTFNVFQMELVDPTWRTTVSGTSSMAMASSRSLISLLAGVLLAAVGYGGVFMMGGGLVALAAVIFWALLVRRHAEAPAQVPAQPAPNP